MARAAHIVLLRAIIIIIASNTFSVDALRHVSLENLDIFLELIHKKEKKTHVINVNFHLFNLFNNIMAQHNHHHPYKMPLYI